MQRNLWLLFVLLVCGVWPAQALTPPVYTLTGRIVSVSDGDTVVMQRGRTRFRIRLASIDAPERSHANRPGQPYGDAAQQFLIGLVQGRIVTARCFEQDHYRRHICDLLLAKAAMAGAGDDQTGHQTVNRRLVAAGFAWANREAGGKFLRDAAMLALERQARQARRGLWQSVTPRPVPPWQWRYQCWQRKRCD